jgi:tagaturonate reductase
MQLSRKILAEVDPTAQELFNLPEKVLQFGTGVLLRGLPDYFIDKANRKHQFNGRVVVVKSTTGGGTDAFKNSDGLYTLLERGVEKGIAVQRTSINAAISRVLSANDDWEAILACASNPALQIIISNTTEVGITLVPEDALAKLPQSFPGRLLAFLRRRFETLGGTKESGMVIVPTELIVDNGSVLKSIVMELANLAGDTADLLHWLDTANDFCNSLVDRIVPGKLPMHDQAATEKQLGYTDELMIMAETYRLWAIETKSDRTKNILSFSQADDGVILSPDIEKFRELKLRLLNATHTFSCGLAALAGFETVKEAMQNHVFASFIADLMFKEIIPLVAVDDVTRSEANAFAAQVIDRFSNPYIDHQWRSICVQYSSKMATRTLPLVQRHYKISQDVPERMALGFAAFLLYSRIMEQSGDTYYAIRNGERYPVQDDKAPVLLRSWSHHQNEHAINLLLSNGELFDADLTSFPGFEEAVTHYLAAIEKHGVLQTLEAQTFKRSIA